MIHTIHGYEWVVPEIKSQSLLHQVNDSHVANGNNNRLCWTKKSRNPFYIRSALTEIKIKWEVRNKKLTFTPPFLSHSNGPSQSLLHQVNDSHVFFFWKERKMFKTESQSLLHQVNDSHCIALYHQNPQVSWPAWSSFSCRVCHKKQRKAYIISPFQREYTGCHFEYEQPVFLPVCGNIF